MRASSKKIYEWTESLARQGYPIVVEVAYGGYKFQESIPGSSGVRRDLSGRLTGGEAMLWLDGFATAANFAGQRRDRHERNYGDRG